MLDELVEKCAKIIFECEERLARKQSWAGRKPETWEGIKSDNVVYQMYLETSREVVTEICGGKRKVV